VVHFGKINGAAAYVGFLEYAEVARIYYFFEEFEIPF